MTPFPYPQPQPLPRPAACCLPVTRIPFQSESKAVADAPYLVKNARNLQPDWISEELWIPRRPFAPHGGSEPAHGSSSQPQESAFWVAPGGEGGGGKGCGAGEPSGGGTLPPEPPVMGTLGHAALSPSGDRHPLAKALILRRNPLYSLLSHPPQEMDFSRPREQGSARGAGLAPVDVSSAAYPLLSHKSGILLPTPPLPSDQDPKNHHFLSACESLINSRQKGLIRKLFGKWKGRGRDGRWPQPVPLGGFAPRRHLPEPRAGPRLGVLKSAPATLPTPSGCRQSSPVDGYLSPCEDSAMKISVYIETFLLLLLFDHCPLAVPNPRHAGKHSRGILTRVSLEGTVGSVIGKGMCNMCCSPDPSAATGSSPPFLPRRPRSSLHPPKHCTLTLTQKSSTFGPHNTEKTSGF